MNALSPQPPAVRTTCPYCGVGCGVLAAPDGDGGAAISGDPAHPANFGRLCSKGAALGETLSLDQRLLHPMLQQADAAILIGDPALIALESREQIEATVGPCEWFDLAHEWHTRTNLPWVAAVWAARPEALNQPGGITAAQLVEDLETSRNHGLLNIERLVEDWTPRIPVPPATIRHYLSSNIHYVLNTDCIRAIELFRQFAAEADILPPLPQLHFL